MNECSLRGIAAISASLAVLLPFRTFGQDTWVWQNPLPQGNKLVSLHLSGGTGLAVGSLGTILRSTDGGKAWQPIESGTRSDFRQVRLLDASRGYAVAGDSILRVTADGGATWTSRPVEELGHLQCVHFLDKDHGFAFGKSYRKVTGEPLAAPQGRFLKTEDGGISWAADSNGKSIDAGKMHFFNRDTGITTGNSGVFRTLDAGRTWSPAGNPPMGLLVDFHFQGPTVGFGVTEEGTVFSTSDGGNGWVLAGRVSLTEAHAVHFVDANKGFVAGRSGSDGILFRTSDGGANWDLVHRIRGSLLALHFEGTGKGYAAGGWGAILESEDGGGTWVNRAGGYGGRLNTVWFVSAAKGFAAGEGGVIFRTEDGGARWDTTVGSRKVDFFGLHFPDSSTGYAVGDSGVILKTADGGKTWSVCASGSQKGLRAVRFLDRDNGMAVGKQGAMLKTRDGGRTWSDQNLGDSADLTSIWLLDANRGYVAGSGGTILWTMDGGLTWQPRKYPGNDGVESVLFFTQDSGMAVIKSGVIRTSNGGLTWSYVQAGSDLGHSVAFAGSRVGYLVGRSGFISKTVNGGTTWSPESSASETELFSIHCPDALTCYAVGDGGAIRKLTQPAVPIIAAKSRAGSGAVGSLVEGELKYRLGIPSLVVATVFDLEGKAVACLANSVQGSGPHALRLSREISNRGFLLELRIDRSRQVFRIAGR